MCCRRFVRRNMKLFKIFVGIVLIVYEFNHIMRQQHTSAASIKGK